MSDLLGKLDDPVRNREQQNGCHNVEHRMHHTDLCLGNIAVCPCRIHNTQICDRYNTENDRSDDIKDQMHQCCGFRIFLCTHTGQDCSYTGTDILSHDNIDCCAKRYKTCCCKALQDSDRRR